MPSFSPLSGVLGRNSATLFEIRLENDFIVLRGSENEAADQILRGTVVLCLPTSLKVEDVHLKLTGTAKIGWNDHRVTPSGISNNKIDKTTEILNHKWDPFVRSGSSSKGVTLAAANYEWPFEFHVSGSMFESVEGLPDCYIKYKLKATVARGKLAYDLHAYKPVRIVRTLDPSALELAHAMTVENIWPNKIEYSLVIPQKAVIFGNQVDLEMRFTSLLKGLKIGVIKCVLVESQEFNIPAPPGGYERSYKNTRNIDSWEFHLNEDEHYSEMLESGQDGWVLHEKLPLPKSLAKCMQDVELSLGIRIRHKVKFNIALLNPDGHTSELRATLPITIFISPNMPLNEEGCLVNQTPMTAQAAADVATHAPPLYGQHVLDQLFAGVDSGLQTPHPQSGMNTPFFAQSRRGSSENIASLDSAVDPTAPVHPDALSSRLHDLNSSSRNSSFIRRQLASGSNTHNQGDGCFANHSADNSTPLSRRNSEEEERHDGISALTSGQQSPEHIDFTDLDLTRVPSYATAVRAPVRGMSYSDAAPNYGTAISTPATPGRGFAAPDTGSPDVETSPPILRRHLPPFETVHHMGDDDGRRRLHMLRARERAH